MNAETVQTAFKTQFLSEPEITVRAPGRINIIGEHTDYNAGFVLPAAIDKAIWLAASKRDDGRFAFYALDLDDFYLSEDATAVYQEKHPWANYILGIVSEARKDGFSFGGLNVVIGGDVPLGAGLSSSAALESGALFALNELYQLGISRMDIVKLAQRGENNFVGMKCGIMDMFASVMGRKNSVVRLDCRNLDFEYFPFETKEYSLVLCDSGVKHALVDSDYNTRREECEAGVAVLKKYDAGISSLRDVSPEFLRQHEHDLSPVIFRRCKYVVEEIERVRQACTALERGDLPALGERMFQTHEGLRREYEVSVPETDFLVECAQKDDAVAGARMMGGGFGGCTINLIKTDALEDFIKKTSAAYEQAFGITLKTYPVRLCDGTAIV